MSTKNYVEILRWAIRNQIDFVREEANEACDTEYKAGYFQGIEKGLEIALEKIDASMFLVKD